MHPPQSSDDPQICNPKVPSKLSHVNNGDVEWYTASARSLSRKAYPPQSLEDDFEDFEPEEEGGT